MTPYARLSQEGNKSWGHIVENGGLGLGLLGYLERPAGGETFYGPQTGVQPIRVQIYLRKPPAEGNRVTLTLERGV